MGKHILIWLAALLVMLLLVPLAFSTDAIWGAVKKEAVMIDAAFGSKEAESIITRAGAFHRAMFIETGLLDKVQKAKATDREEQFALPGTGQALTKVTNSYVESLGAMMFGVAMRIIILFGWLPFIIPFLLAAVGEGYARRKIKFATFGQYGVMVYAGAAHLAIILLMAPLVYLVLPFAVPPLFVPFWALCAAVPIVTMIANMSQVLPH
jgi:ABC-type multidrug transport system fused ATPase/permease subunit